MVLRGLLESTPSRLAGRSSDLLQLAVMAATFSAAVAAWVASHPDMRLVATVLLLTATIFAVSLRALNGYVRSFDKPRDFDIEILEGQLDVDRVVDSKGCEFNRCTYTRKQLIQALVKIWLVELREHWSGQIRIVEETRSIFPEHRVLDGKIPEEDGKTRLWVYPLGPIPKGRRVWVGIKRVFEDAYAPMKTYYRESGEERRVKTMIVRLTFDPQDAPQAVWMVIWKRTKSGSTREEVSREECMPIDGGSGGRVVYENRVNSPGRDRAYGFWWRPSQTSRHAAAASDGRPASAISPSVRPPR
jgi:hypothetical protein